MGVCVAFLRERTQRTPHTIPHPMPEHSSRASPKSSHGRFVNSCSLEFILRGTGGKEDRLAYHHLFCLFTVAYFNSLMHKVNTLDRRLVLFMVVWITLVLMLRDILISNVCFCLMYSEHEQFFSEFSKKFFCCPTGVWLRNIAPSAQKRMSPGEFKC